MIDRTSFETFTTFAAADEAARRERWAMSADERLDALEQLRCYQYEDGEASPRLQRILETIEFPPS